MRTLQGTAVHVEKVTAPDDGEIRALLDFLPVLYPGGAEWLKRRLNDVRVARALLFCARVDGELAGAAIGLPKSTARFKVSTLYTSPGFRGRGVGTSLLTTLLSTPEATRSTQAYITGAETVRGGLQPLLARHGFHLIATEVARYGAGRNEDVYVR